MQAQREAAAQQHREAEQRAAQSRTSTINYNQNSAAGIALAQYSNGYKHTAPEKFSRHPQQSYEKAGWRDSNGSLQSGPVTGSSLEAQPRANDQPISSSPAPSPRVQQIDRQNSGQSLNSASPSIQPNTSSGNGTGSDSPLAQISSANIRVVYEKFRTIINPKGGKPSAREGTNSDVSGILAKKVVDRFLVCCVV